MTGQCERQSEDKPPAVSTSWLLRNGCDADGPALIALIWSCWSTYPGLRMDVERDMPELRALASYYAAQAGALWLAEADGQVVGMTAVRRHSVSAMEICRVYVDPAWHGSGLGHDLLNRAEAFAVASGAERLVLWSDTRFDRAHRFYEKHSYIRHGPIRVLDDISSSLEFGYAKPVNGVQTLDIAAASSAAGRLAEILIACADTGASNGFPARDQAVTFWRRAATEVGAARKVIVAAWRHAVLSGVGILDLATSADQRHRADVQEILVDPASRRSGLGRKILNALEQAATNNNRSLLTATASPDESRNALFHAEGWFEAGQIPDFARTADGSGRAAAIFWKRIV